MKYGIELISKQPTLNQQQKLWQNWLLMSEKQKTISDKKSIEIFGISNQINHKRIMKFYWNIDLDKQFDLIYEHIRYFHFYDELSPIMLSKNLFKNVNYSFNSIYKKLIMQDYAVFPVPKLLLDDMQNIVQKGIQKTYTLKDLQKYISDWKYYNQFNENIKLMLSKNYSCSISIIGYDDNNKKTLNKIQKKFNISLNQLQNNQGILSIQKNSYDSYLLIKTYNNRKIRKKIQHQLIHWMQVYLNEKTKKSYGKFNDIPFNLTQQQINFLQSITNINIANLYSYLLSGKQFQAWVANTYQQFIDSGLTIQQFKNIIQNDKKLIYYIWYNNDDFDKIQMIIFAKFCYYASLNNSKDDRYWYLIEALQEK